MKTFLNGILMMKRLRRQGWVRAGVPISSVESIAEHSFGTALIAMLLAIIHNSKVEEEHKKVDIFRCVTIAILHDFPESMFLDVDKSFDELLGPSASKIKEELDKNAIKQLLDGVPGDQAFLETLLQPSPSIEKTLVDYADKLELIAQAKDYKRIGVTDSALQDFLSSSHSLFSTTDLQAVKEVYQALAD
ncbi:MAG: HD family hydrolase [Promethearchaeota archaeon]